MQEWLKSAEKWLHSQWGLSPNFAVQIALFLAYLYAYGLNPRVTSGWRDPAKQKAMRAAWDRGDRQGLRARPAVESAHTASSWLGGPAADAVDIVTSNDQLAAQIARALKIGVGLEFSTPDPGHYYART